MRFARVGYPTQQLGNALQRILTKGALVGRIPKNRVKTEKTSATITVFIIKLSPVQVSKLIKHLGKVMEADTQAEGLAETRGDRVGKGAKAATAVLKVK